MSEGGQRQFDDVYLLRWLRGKDIILKLLIFSTTDNHSEISYHFFQVITK